MRRPRRILVAPELPQGPFYLNPNGPGFFSIIVPIARTNLVTNPSGELCRIIVREITTANLWHDMGAETYHDHRRRYGS
jgi:hypothetical protein